MAVPPWRRVAAGVAILTAAIGFGPGAGATGGSGTTGAAPELVRYVSARSPILGPGRELGAVRPARPSVPVPVVKVSTGAPAWHLLATIPGAVVRDISFATPSVGYAVAELGQVWKTTDGGRTWTSVLNLGFPYYWYGVDALSPNHVVISGFDNAAFTALARWTDDGGVTWSDDILLADQGWANRVRFAGTKNGLVVDLVNLDAANKVQYTSTGGQTERDWTSAIPDSDGGWFGADFTLLPDLTAYISGITECRSPSGGASWTCEPPVDPVFDGSVEYVDHQHGWVGGGSIAPSVEGWAYRTTDGGATWSDRTLHSPWPVRDIEFLTPRIGWAAGGDLFSGLGGMYLSKDGGQTWTLDADTGAEMLSCTSVRRGNRVRVWCAGSTGSFQGVIYGLELTIG